MVAITCSYHDMVIVYSSIGCDLSAENISQDKVNTQNLTIPGLQLFYPVWGRYMAVPPQVL